MDLNSLAQAVRLYNKLDALAEQKRQVAAFECFRGPVTENKAVLGLAVTAMFNEIDRQIQQAEQQVLDLQ